MYGLFYVLHKAQNSFSFLRNKHTHTQEIENEVIYKAQNMKRL